MAPLVREPCPRGSKKLAEMSSKATEKSRLYEEVHHPENHPTLHCRLFFQKNPGAKKKVSLGAAQAGKESLSWYLGGPVPGEAR